VNDNEDIDLGDADDAAVEFPCAKAMIKNTTPALDVGSLITTSSIGSCLVDGATVSAKIEVSSTSFSKTIKNPASGKSTCYLYIYKSIPGRLTLTLSAATSVTLEVYIGFEKDKGVPTCKLKTASKVCTWTDATSVIKITDSAVSGSGTFTATLAYSAY